MPSTIKKLSNIRKVSRRTRSRTPRIARSESDVMCARENARIASLRRLEEVMLQNTEPKTTPEFRVEF